MLKIAVLVSGGGTNLQALLDAEKSGKFKNGHISIVISSNNEAYALQRAKNSNVSTAVLVRKTFKTQSDYDNALINILENNNIDLIVLAGFMTIISENVIQHFENRIINIHPSLIPSFCGEGFFGLRVHKAALKRGVKVTGATVHFVNQICDGGPIILQKPVNIEQGDTPEVLQKRVMQQAEWQILPKAVELFCDGRLSVKDGIVNIKEEK